MRLRVILALALLLGAWGRPVTAQLQSPFSNSVFPAQIFTASGQTGNTIQMNNLTVSSTVGSSFASGTITVTGSSLATATFTVLGSSDNGATFNPLPIYTVLTPGTTPSTTITVSGNSQYQISLVGMTHIKFVTSGTFTATNLSLVLTATPNGGIARFNTGGGGTTGVPCLGVANWTGIVSFLTTQFTCFQGTLYTATVNSIGQQPSPDSAFWTPTFFSGAGSGGGGVIIGGQFFSGGALSASGTVNPGFASGSGNPLDYEQQIGNDVFQWGAENDSATQNYWTIELINTAAITPMAHNFTVNWASGGIGKDEWHQANDNFICWATGDSATGCDVGLSLDSDGVTVDVGVSKGDHSRNMHLHNLTVDGTCSGCGGGGSSGFPFSLGGTSIAAGSTNSTINALALTNSTVNGVTLNAAGSTSLFLNQAGGYSSIAAGGTVTDFLAPSSGWPTWLVPTVTNPTTTPSLSVAASAIPNSALANASLTLGSTSVSLGGTVAAITGISVNGVTLNAAGSASLFLNQAGGYSTPPVTALPTATAAGQMPYATTAGTTYTTDGNLTRTTAGHLRQAIGSAITAAATIAPTSPVTHVSGSATITVITPPTGCGSSGTDCTIKLIADASSTWSTATGGGAGGFASSSVATVGQALYFTLDPATDVWYPATGNNFPGPVTIGCATGTQCPGSFVLPFSATGAALPLGTNSFGIHAPTSAGSSYYWTPAPSATAGFLVGAAPAVGSDGTLQQQLAYESPEWNLASTLPLAGSYAVGTHLADAVVSNAGKFANLQSNYAPAQVIYANTAENLAQSQEPSFFVGMLIQVTQPYTVGTGFVWVGTGGTSGDKIDIVITPATGFNTQTASDVCRATYTETGTAPNAFVPLTFSSCALPVGLYWVGFDTNDVGVHIGAWTCSNSSSLDICTTGSANFGNPLAGGFFVAQTYGTDTAFPTTFTGQNTVQPSVFLTGSNACTTPPTVNVEDITTSTVGTPLALTASGFASQPQTGPSVNVGDHIALVVTAAGAQCNNAFPVSAQVLVGEP